MKILMIAAGFLPYTFSENLCNGKLALALKEAGHQVSVITKKDEGPTYSEKWGYPWDSLEPDTHSIVYPVGTRLQRYIDLFKSGWISKYPFEGTRWVSRAIKLGKELLQKGKYDCILSRAPNDYNHVVGYHLSRYSRLPWIANWNDPAAPIWPEPYKHHFPRWEQFAKDFFTRFLLKHSDCNTFPSVSLRDHFQEHYPFLKNARTEIIPHIGLIEKYFPTGPGPSKDGVLRLCHSGNLSEERNPEALFRALQHLDAEFQGKIQFDLLGRRTPICDALLGKYHLEHMVHFPGSFPYLEALKKMNAYDVLVLVEALMKKGIFFASKIVDYAQLRKPILAISPRSGFAADMLGKYGMFVSDNTSEEHIYSSLKEIYRKFTINTLTGSEHLYDEFSPPNVVKRLENVIAECRGRI